MASEGANMSPAEKAKQDALYENREPKKIIRIITVMAYMTSVSFVGIVLSAYYIFLWHPPNPRLMHANSQMSHHQARVDFLVVDEATTAPPRVVNRIAKEPMTIDLIASAAEEAGSLKTRREIVKNVNAILRANFERVRSSESTYEEETLSPMVFNDTVENSTSSVPPAENSTLESSSEDSTSNEVTESESLGMPTALTPTSTTRKTRSLGKKQHQTPFALKHLEVPIKSEGAARRKSLRFASSTARSSDDGSGSSPDSRSASEASQRPPEPPSPEFGVKDLLKILSSPSRGNRASTDYPDSLPSISSDQFQAVEPQVPVAGDLTTELYSEDSLDD